MENIDCEKLIELVHDHDILYDQQHPGYMDNNRKNNVWKVIAAEMDKNGQYFSI